MHDETQERMRAERETARRAECFARLVLTDREDHDGRKLLDYAERTANRLPMQWEKTIAWLSLALRGNGVDETTLTGIGFERQEVRHATIVQPRENEPAMGYAERLAAYNEPEVFAVGEAMLNETADTNPTVPSGTTNTARDAGIDRLRSAHREWANARQGDRPPAGGIADNRPTAPGLIDALRRLECAHDRLCLNEMHRGPANARWGIAERLSIEDLDAFLYAASLLTINAAGMMVETSVLTTAPATETERATMMATREPGTTHLSGIATTAATMYEIATRLQTEIPLPESGKERIH